MSTSANTPVVTGSSAVSRPAAAPSAGALKHFEHLLQFETDCWDVHHAISNARQDFVLLDVRGEELFTRGHIAGAVNLPHTRINADSLSVFSGASLFVAVSYTHLTLPTKRIV